MTKRVPRLAPMVACAVLAAAALSASTAVAAAPAPRFAVQANAFPTDLTASPPPRTKQFITVLVTNTGAAPTAGAPITIQDTVPAGLTVLGVEAKQEVPTENVGKAFPCVASARTVTCTDIEALPGEDAAALQVNVEVGIEPGLSTGTYHNGATVSGGGALTVSQAETITVNATQPSFGLEEPFIASAFNAAGAVDTQAGSHPSSVATAFVINHVFKLIGDEGYEPAQEVKDVSIQLPPGLVGDPLAAPTCPETLLVPPGEGKACPTGSVIGSVTYLARGFDWLTSGHENISAIYNVTPQSGHAAEFGFLVLNQLAILYADLVHTPAGYAVRVTSSNIVSNAHLVGIKVTVFGNPAAHDGGAIPAKPFFTAPSDCSAGPAKTLANFDSWQSPAALPQNPDGSPNVGATNFSEPGWLQAVAESPPVTGCENLTFQPSMTLLPDTAQSGSPSGLGVDLKIPQNEAIEGLATPPLRDTTVTLPEGMVVNPSQANGLQACSDAQFAAETTELATCPDASRIGTVTVHTPILADPLEGQVFLGSPECGPCSDADAQAGRLARLFIQVHSDRYGITLKIPGNVSLNPATGQLTATFKNSPQQPFDELKLQLKGGPRAPLVTPTACGSYASAVDLSPWSAPFTPDAVFNSSFNISEGCGPRGFAPSSSAGTTSPQAGAYSPFTLSFSRGDGEQYLDALEETLPPGLLGKLAGIPLCGNAEAAAGQCPAASRIGSITVAAGPGADPYYVTGSVYLTGPYNGGPYGEVAVVPAVAGPFNLGTVTVRGAIRVNPATAQATVASDPFPSILDGIPLQVRTVNVTLDRPGFTFNATGCSAQAVSGRLLSTQGAAAGISSPYQASNCAALPFKPAFTASTQGQTSKQRGASLDVKVSARQGPDQGAGEEANIRKVDVQLPKALPSELRTLQKACLLAVFQANPASCPPASFVGTAIAHTPLLSDPLEGPAILVSYGGAKFPDVVLVLQGDGVTVDLTGETEITKGLTYSKFETLPDAPITSFELRIPQRPSNPLLGSYIPNSSTGNFCNLTTTKVSHVKRRVKGKLRTVTIKARTTGPAALVMPTTITAQNGAVVKQNTRIALQGCPTAHKPARAAGGGLHATAHSTRKGR